MVQWEDLAPHGMNTKPRPQVQLGGGGRGLPIQGRSAQQPTIPLASEPPIRLSARTATHEVLGWVKVV